MDRTDDASLDRRWRRWLIATVVIVGVGLLGIGAFPVGVLRGLVADRISAAVGAPVQIGSITRDRWFSYTPVITIGDVRIAQPAWAGAGDLLRLRRLSLRVPVVALLTGRFQPEQVDVDGLVADLIRTADKRTNWQREPSRPAVAPSTEAPHLGDIRLRNVRFRLRDQRRGLDVAGPISLDAVAGLRLVADGQFLSTPAHIEAQGGRIAGVDRAADYPFKLALTSPALTMTATATLAGPLNARLFHAVVRARAPTLKNLDRIIEAGLFGSQPIDLTAELRHIGRDWLIDRLAGSMGRSVFAGRVDVRKRDGRTKLDATLHASQLDFDDLADDAGLARAAALRAQIGQRLIPNTRINLSKIGRTDGRMVLTADRIVTKSGPVVLSLRGVLTLDHRRLAVTEIAADLANSGHLSGRLDVDHASGRPKLTVDLRIAGGDLARIIHRDDLFRGRIDSRIMLRGSGDTVREALSHADGKVGNGGTNGEIRAIAADMLGQDFGKAVHQVVARPSAIIPMQCFIAEFRARGGVLTPDPVAFDAGTASGRATGNLFLRDETIALTLRGWTDHPGAGYIEKPITVGGTFSKPDFAIGGLAVGARGSVAHGVLGGIGKMVGRTLGLHKTPVPPPKPPAIDCAATIAAVLREGAPGAPIAALPGRRVRLDHADAPLPALRPRPGVDARRVRRVCRHVDGHPRRQP